MPRKGPIEKRDVLPDPIYNSKLVTRLINKMMLGGKRGTSQNILYNAFSIIQEKTGNDPLEVFEQAMENIQPMKYIQHLTHLSNKLIFLVNSISLSNKKYSSSLGS